MGDTFHLVQDRDLDLEALRCKKGNGHSVFVRDGK